MYFIEYTHDTLLNEQKTRYQSEIDEYRTKIDQLVVEKQDLQSNLLQTQEENRTLENRLSGTTNVLKQEYENQCKELRTEISRLKERGKKILSISSILSIYSMINLFWPL